MLMSMNVHGRRRSTGCRQTQPSCRALQCARTQMHRRVPPPMPPAPSAACLPRSNTALGSTAQPPAAGAAVLQETPMYYPSTSKAHVKVLQNTFVLCFMLYFAPDSSRRTWLQGRTALPGPSSHRLLTLYSCRLYQGDLAFSTHP